MSLLGFIWLERLARSEVLDFWLLLSEFYRKTALSCSKNEVEHDFSKAHVPVVNLKLLCQPSNFIIAKNALVSLEVEHDFPKAHVPAVILKLVCQPSNFIRFLNP